MEGEHVMRSSIPSCFWDSGARSISLCQKNRVFTKASLDVGLYGM